MSEPFLITGLPRCRTAWLAAVACTIPGAICFHEPIALCRHWRDAATFWIGAARRFAGISDSAFGFHLGELLATYRPRTIVVLRNLNAVVESLERIGVPDAFDYVAFLYERLQPHLSNPLVKTVQFDDLVDNTVVKTALEHMIPTAQIDLAKLVLLQRFDIQAKIADVFDSVRAQGSDAGRALGEDVMQELARRRAARATNETLSESGRGL